MKHSVKINRKKKNKFKNIYLFSNKGINYY